MSLRSPALVGMACIAVIATVALSGCQNDSTPEADATSSAPISALASKVPTKIREDGVLTIGIDPSYPPMEFLQRGEAIGADLDIISAVAQRLGLRAQFIEDSYALLVPGVAAGRFEAAISALSVDDNDLQNANMVTYYSAGSQLAVRPPAKMKFGPRNLCGRKITVLDGSQQYAQLSEKAANCVEQKKKPIRILTFQSQAPATQAVINAKAYGTLAESPVIQSAVAESGGALVVNGKPFVTAPYGIAVDNRRRKMASAIRGALKALIADGTYLQILEKWDISEGSLNDPEVLTKKDIVAPTPLFTESVTPSPALSPTG